MRKRKITTFDVINTMILCALMLICVYPFIYVIFASFSEPWELVMHQGLLFRPLGFTLDGYKAVFANRQIWSGYFTTLFNLVVGTSLNIFLTLLAAYGISRKDLMFRKPLTIMIVFTMFFNSGIIPRFLVVQDLGLYDTRMSMILPTAINVFNLVIMRTAIEGIPGELEEAALLDGASHFTILFKVITPLIKSTMAASGPT